MVLHVCLAGTAITRDWPFIRRLKARCCVSLVRQLTHLPHTRILDSADAIVVDCCGASDTWLDVLCEIRARVPGAPVILIDGGMTQEEIACGLGSGAIDYFAEPYAADLLLQRVEVLAQQSHNARTSGGSSTPRTRSNS